MKAKSYKIDLEIYIVFIIVIGISVFNAIYSSYNITGNQEMTDKIIATEIPSLQKLEQMNLIVTRSKMYTTNWVYLQTNSEDKEKLRVLHSIEYPALRNSILNLTTRWKEKAQADTMISILRRFENLMVYQKQVMHTLTRFDDYEDPMKRFAAEEILENQVLPQSASIINGLNSVVLERKAKVSYRFEEMKRSSRVMMWSVLGMAFLIVLVILVAAFYISNHIIVPTMKLKNYVLQMGKGEIPDMHQVKYGSNAIGQMSEAVNSLAQSLKKTAHFAHDIGEGNFSVEYQPLSKNDELGNALIQMRESLRRVDDENRQRTWISTGIERINEIIRENNDDLDKLADGIIGTLSRYLNAAQGALYVVDDNNSQLIRLHGSYASERRPQDKVVVRRGEGLIGQAIKDGQNVYLENIQTPTTKVVTGVSEYSPSYLLIIPLKIHGIVYGAVELSSFKPFENYQIDFVRSIGQSIGSTINSVRANMLTKRLLDETRLQADRLQSQEEQLIRTNEELSNQSKLLQQSEDELKASNMELKNNARELQHKNEVLEQAREALSIKAKELEMNNKFKSEFLANMSHELRTPLNSVLILAKLLSEKESKNLTPKQIEYAKVIHKSGSDLLSLINDILDLSKMEAGKIELLPENVIIGEVANDLRMLFEQLAIEKSINFTVHIDDHVPSQVITDKMRLEQVLKNLLSNAFKFTPANGSVELSVGIAERGKKFSNTALYSNGSILKISVTDTGIGIPEDKQALIFEPFQQADGSTSRKYGGTGLGLSISKMLISLLGGEMQLSSEPGKGSCFSIYIPVEQPNEHVSHETIAARSLTDDRASIVPGDKVVLIAEEDPLYAGLLMDFAHRKKYKAVLATERNEVIEFTGRYKPEAILMNMVLSDADGVGVLKDLRSDERFKSIPIHMITPGEFSASGPIRGATGYLKKPLDKCDLDKAFESIKSDPGGLKRILLIEDLEIHQEIIRNLITCHHNHIILSTASNVEEANGYLSEHLYDCIILDLDLGNGVEEGYRFLQQVKSNRDTTMIPVIIFTAQDIQPEFREMINTLSEAFIPKTPDSFNTLLDQTDQVLRINEQTENVPAPTLPYEHLVLLSGKTVLLVDDDMRNIYAITSMLESESMTVIPAVNGKDALSKIQGLTTVPDIILMDIMMPEMDGYEAIRRLRTIAGYENVPVIAITAKAMPQDKEKCLQAGANDYMSKPVNAEKLFAMMRLWLFKDNDNV